MNSARLILTIALAAAAAPCRAEPAPGGFSLPSAQQAVVNQDPLMSQIFRRQLTQKNGGVTAVVRVATGQSVELQVPELEMALSGAAAPSQASASAAAKALNVHSDLAPKTPAKAAKRRAPKAASEQLKDVHKKGWDEKNAPVEAPPKRANIL